MGRSIEPAWPRTLFPVSTHACAITVQGSLGHLVRCLSINASYTQCGMYHRTNWSSKLQINPPRVSHPANSSPHEAHHQVCLRKVGRQQAELAVLAGEHGRLAAVLPVGCGAHAEGGGQVGMGWSARLVGVGGHTARAPICAAGSTAVRLLVAIRTPRVRVPSTTDGAKSLCTSMYIPRSPGVGVVLVGHQQVDVQAAKRRRHRRATCQELGARAGATGGGLLGRPSSPPKELFKVVRCGQRRRLHRC